MKLKIVVVIIFIHIVWVHSLYAQWQRLTGELYGRSVYSVAIHPEKPELMFAGGEGYLYVSRDSGKSWKTTLKLGLSESRVNIIMIDRQRPQDVYAGTDEGVYFSGDRGRKWRRIFEGADALEEKVRALAVDPTHSGVILVGTQRGLQITQDRGVRWRSVPDFAGHRIDQILAMKSEDHGFLLSSDGGLYRSGKKLNEWKKIYYPNSFESSVEEGNAQMGLEEMSIGGSFLSFIMTGSSEESIFLVKDRNLFRSSDQGQSWKALKINALQSQVRSPIVALDPEQGQLFLPTESDIYFYKASENRVKRISWGLPAAGIHTITYSAVEDTLYAGTDKGVYKLLFPEVTIFLKSKHSLSRHRGEEIFALFKSEPTIQECHHVAIRYAEVSPQKISDWRKKASMKAWIPALSVGQDWSRDENVDLDRGGTADPDQYIKGPLERDQDFSIDLRWDLSELVWNPDQTSIDVRSKLMAQLREDVLNQMTHLYFARRRMQIEMMLSPSKDIASEVERQLQIQEYTAGIDALTGGYFSKALLNVQAGNGKIHEF